jgi:tRNA wybutosine-synthesizing protein 4
LLDFLKRALTEKEAEAPQVIVMGAGYDTTYFQLAVDHPKLIQHVKYVELDLPEVINNKICIIRSNPRLAHLAGLPEEIRNAEATSFCGDNYSIHPADLRKLEDVDRALQTARIQGNAPTIIMLECVAVYMEHQEGNLLLQWAAEKFENTDAAIVLYEQFNPHDAFGRQMMLNLSIRGCPLRGILPSLPAHEHRLRAAGWDEAVALGMNDVWKLYFSELEKRRVQRLEFMDEFEEWELLQSHYCVAVATKKKEKSSLLTNFLDFSCLRGFRDDEKHIL